MRNPSGETLSSIAGLQLALNSNSSALVMRYKTPKLRHHKRPSLKASRSSNPIN